MKLLPAQAARSTGGAMGSRASNGRTSKDRPERRSRVLVVDDEPMMGTTLRMAMAEAHDVVFVQSGEAARTLLERDRDFDAIVCDLMMPDLSGMDLYTWLDQRHADVAGRMIFMTGGAYTDASRRFLDAVDNPRIQKPFDVDELLQIVERISPRKAT
jgi:DNA-binding response OmpR family regulator